MQLPFKHKRVPKKTLIAFFGISLLAHIGLLILIVAFPSIPKQTTPEALIVAMVEMPEDEPEPELKPPPTPNEVSRALLDGTKSESFGETQGTPPPPETPAEAPPEPTAAPVLSPDATTPSEKEGNGIAHLDEPDAEPETSPEDDPIASNETQPAEPKPPISEDIPVPEEEASEAEPKAAPVSEAPATPPAPEAPEPKTSPTSPPVEPVESPEVAKPAAPQTTPPVKPQIAKSKALPKVAQKVTPPPPKPSKKKLKKTGLLALLEKNKKNRRTKLRSKLGNRLRQSRKPRALRKNNAFARLSARTKKNLNRLKTSAVSSEQNRLLKRKAPSQRSQRSKIKITHGSGRNYGVISKAIEQKKGRLSTVYTALLQSNPELQGNLIVEFSIAPGGRVSKCQILTSSLENPSFESALLKEICLWKFPSVTQGETTVLYPLSFFPAS